MRHHFFFGGNLSRASIEGVVTWTATCISVSHQKAAALAVASAYYLWACFLQTKMYLTNNELNVTKFWRAPSNRFRFIYVRDHDSSLPKNVACVNFHEWAYVGHCLAVFTIALHSTTKADDT